MGENRNATEEGAARGPSVLERWLGSPWRRLVLLLVVIVIASAYMAQSWTETVELMGGDPRWSDFFGRRLVAWGSWALFVEPVIWFARRTVRWFGSVWLVLLVHVPVSFAFVPVLAHVQEGLSGSLFGDAARGPGLPGSRGPEPPPGEGLGEPRPGGRLPRDARRGRWRFGAERRERSRFYARLLSYWAILGAAWTIHTHLRNRAQERRTSELELRASRLEKELVSAQLSNLRNQLHPHFLFNALHSVGGLIRQRQDEVAVDTLSALGSLLRAALDQEQRQLVPLNEELDLVERYLDIERQRLGERLDVTTRVEAGASRAPVPSLLLLPLVENAIKYAVAPRPEGAAIEIAARREGDELVLEVSDDGPGFPPEVRSDALDTDVERVRIGLRNTRSRLAALYGAAARMETSNAPAGGAVVRIVLPLPRAETEAAS